MKIETKFNVNDPVWVIHKNKAENTKIESIKVDTYKLGDVKIQYCVNVDPLRNESGYHFIPALYYENEMFTSKEELINSL